MRKFRLLFDKDEETRWLNEISSQGWALQSFFAGFYTFVPCEPNEYTYQVDLLDKNKKANYDEYCEFLKEADVTVVQRWFYWVVLSKKTEDGPFEMYTDSESLIEHYKSILHMFTIALCAEAACLALEITAFIRLLSGNAGFGEIAFASFVIIFISDVVLTFLKAVWQTKWKIQQLQEDTK